MPRTNCIDAANYTRLLTPADVQRWKDAGIELVIVGIQYPNPPYPPGNAHHQLRTLINGGMRVECYAESQSVSYAWQFISQFKPFIERIWVAAEEDHVDEAWMDAEFAFIDSLNLPQRSGVYSAPWWTSGRPWMAKYADRPYWHASYDGAPGNIAPFKHITIWQHAGTSTFAGVEMVDLNEHYELYRQTDSRDVQEEPLSDADRARITELEGRLNDLTTVMYGRTWEDRDQEAADAAIEAGGLVHHVNIHEIDMGATQAVLNVLSERIATHTHDVAPKFVKSAVQPVITNGADGFLFTTNLMRGQKWLEITHNCTFDLLPLVIIDAPQDYEAIKAACIAKGLPLDIPTLVYAPGPITMPGSFSDAAMLAVKEVPDANIQMHEWAHLATGTGGEAHAVVITDDNPFDTVQVKPSILGWDGQNGFPNAQLAPEHLQAALSRGYIRRI